jgi:uncharacterized protein
MRDKLRFVLLTLMALGIALAPGIAQSNPLSFQSSSTRLYTQVNSLYEMRWDKLTRQGWDISCGAAALSTLLTYNNNHPFSEMAITLSILKNSDPALVRQRGGFSLFDLKRFVNAIGLQGLGYGEMTIEDLDNFALPAILPLRIKGFDHFVIFRQHLGNRILLGDPAFGNTTFPTEKFLRMWKSRIAFYVVNDRQKQRLTQSDPVGKTHKPVTIAIDAPIPDPGYTPRVLNRIPLLPLTRRNRIPKP